MDLKLPALGLGCLGLQSEQSRAVGAVGFRLGVFCFFFFWGGERRPTKMMSLHWFPLKTAEKRGDLKERHPRLVPSLVGTWLRR